MKISVSLGKPSVSVSIGAPAVGVSTGTPIAREYVERPAYEGDYDVVPSEEGTVLQTKDQRMTDDVRIAPIPNNYARMSWNGVILTFY